MRSAPAPDLPRTSARPATPHRLLPGAVLGLLALAMACTRSEVDPPSEPEVPISIVTEGTPNAIAAENAQPGTDRWHNAGDQGNLNMWASPYAPKRGDTLYAHINSPDSGEGSFEVFRLGWYGGMGGREIRSRHQIKMGPQPPCTGGSPPPIECPWTGTPTVVVDSTWLAGIYMLRVNSPTGNVGFYPFVVSSTRDRALLGVVPQFTWQAYNDWGHSSLYTVDPATGTNAVKVSFERPYNGKRGLFGADTLDPGNGFSAMRFLEEQGVDIGYVSDLDLARSDRFFPAQYHGLVFLGHSEYWTWEEFDRVQAIRDAGHHLAFLGSNSAYWRVRLQASGVSGTPATRIVCYKNSTDVEAAGPTDVTTLFRRAPLSRPENQLAGIMYMSLLPSGATPGYVVAPDSLAGTEGAGLLRVAALQPGDSVAINAGREVDQIVDNGYSPSGLQTLLTGTYGSGVNTRVFQSTLYQASSGAEVWATGTNNWGRYLDPAFGTPNPAVLRLTGQIVSWMMTH